jgi:type II secretory pathway component PulF
LYPNKANDVRSTELRFLQRTITEKLEKKKKEEMIEHVENWELFSEKLSTLQLESKEMKKMLKEILTHLKFPKN